MKNKRFILPALFVLTVSVMSCFNSGSSGTSTVTINLGHGKEDNRSFRAAASENITEIVVRVEAEDMETISESVPLETGIITLEVPSGDARVFTVTAQSTGMIVTYEGSTTNNLTAGESITVGITMQIVQTKIVIPDYNNSRVVQIDDMTGAGWASLESGVLESNLGFDGFNLYPYDATIDNAGRIYICNYTDATYGGGIIRIDNISGDNAVILPSGGVNRPLAVHFDRAGDYIYYSDENNILYRIAMVDPGTPEQLSLDEIFMARAYGISTDSDGILYLAIFGEENGLVKLDFDDPPASIEDTDKYKLYNTYDNDLFRVWDVLVKDDYIYIADYDYSGASNQVVRLDPDFVSSVSLPSSPDGSDNFNGPHRFVATLNRKIYVVDEDENSSSETERVAAFDDISGGNWESFDPSMTGESAFSFYSFC